MKITQIMEYEQRTTSEVLQRIEGKGLAAGTARTSDNREILTMRKRISNTMDKPRGDIGKARPEDMRNVLKDIPLVESFGRNIELHFLDYEKQKPWHGNIYEPMIEN